MKPKKGKATRMQITAAGRERLAAKRASTGDGGMQDAINWAAMAAAGKGQAYTPEQEANRKAMVAAEKQQSYKAGLGVNMRARSKANVTWKARAARDNAITLNKGKRRSADRGGGAENQGSLWGNITDTVFGDGDKYDKRGNKRTSQEQQLARLRRTQKGWTKAAKKRAAADEGYF